MSTGLGRVWCAAVVLALASVLWLMATRPPGVQVGGAYVASDLPEAPIVFIGTSLLACGVAPHGRNILGDGRAHARLAASNLDEEHIVALAERVLAAGTAHTIVLEVNPFFRTFASRPEPGDEPVFRRWLAGLQQRLHLIRGVLVARFKAEVGMAPPVTMMLEDKVLRPAPGTQDRQLAATYPLKLREPRTAAQLQALVARARASGREIVFVLPPRPLRAVRHQGVAVVARQDARAAALASHLGVRLIPPRPLLDDAWPDELFVDHGHLNPAGRARWAQELAAVGGAPRGR
jgi:hypothetical protein